TLDFAGDTTGLGGDIADAGALVFAQTSDSAFNGTISGAGGVTQAGGGTLTLAGANSYGGVTSILSGALAFTGDTSNLTGAMVDATTLIFDQSGDSSVRRTISGAGRLIQQGDGVLMLKTAVSYTGGTEIDSGTLLLAPGATLANKSVLVVNGGTFDPGGQNAFFSDVGGTGGAILLGAASLNLGSANSTTLAAAISGTGGLNKFGTGTLTLSGVESWSGATTVNQGSLRFTGDIDQLTGEIDNVGTLIFATDTTKFTGAIVNDRKIVFTQVGDSSYGGAISGIGGLTQNGGHTLTLSGSITETGT